LVAEMLVNEGGKAQLLRGIVLFNKILNNSAALPEGEIGVGILDGLLIVSTGKFDNGGDMVQYLEYGH
jgi:hypothetical protein